ncbi:YnjH family protein [Vibrio intestinalis]|uniref:YnjH family protein n=1 Tax=Vibrio intestinalis TaxID=2933291 RepID=UPI0021A8171F|nr:YnjH family protein [Vibrio intestinalis]
MHKIYSLIALCLFSLPSQSAEKVLRPPVKPVVVVDGAASSHRLCYYQDEAYSLGAVIKVDDYLLRCQEENDFETNGAVIWAALKK